MENEICSTSYHSHPSLDLIKSCPEDIPLENNNHIGSFSPKQTTSELQTNSEMEYMNSKAHTPEVIDDAVDSSYENGLPHRASPLVAIEDPIPSDERLTRSKPTDTFDPFLSIENITPIACDIFCDADGNLAIVSPNSSHQFFDIPIFHNKASDTTCPPLPYNAKQIFLLSNTPTNDLKPVMKYTLMSPDSVSSLSTSSSRTAILICLSCKLFFSKYDDLKNHASKQHNIQTKDSPILPASAAIIQTATVSFQLFPMLFDGNIAADKLRGRLSGNGDRHSGSSGTGLLSSPLLSRTYMVFCEDHNTEPAEHCSKCEMMITAARSMSGPITNMMHSRNSCKTLKCPKCNWHYKYQETLEIHMKEKHPDSEQRCMYCATKQPHPKLSRGESYICDYKPYRCEICNYSTTTKGNLSIHMQSDKHINNMQEIQQSGTSVLSMNRESGSVSPTTTALVSSTPSTLAISTSLTSPGYPASTQSSAQSRQKAVNQPLSQKGMWRCDVCNYETNIARNLRIHMTSEKHTHNMIILQQNVKSMQRNMSMTMGSLVGGQSDAAAIQQLGTMFPFDPMGIVGQMEALSQQQGGDSDLGKMGEDILSSQYKRSRDIYGCVICNVFTSDDHDELEMHLNVDRSCTTNAEHVTITPENHYLCNLCQYKTSLKANFQLHCKTDKHVQRVQLVNHIREGGTENEWRMRYLNIPNPIHIVCNVCAYQSNNIHKMRLHALSPSHTIGASLFVHLRKPDELTSSYQYPCGLCSEVITNKISMVAHVRKTHASAIEQQAAGGWNSFKVIPGSTEPHNGDDIGAGGSGLSAAVKPEKVVHREPEVQCPLCSDRLNSADLLETHLMDIHNVTKDGAERLMSLIDTTLLLTVKEEGVASDFFSFGRLLSTSHEHTSMKESASGESLRCQTCTKTFKDIEALFTHQNQQEHLELRSTPRGPGYLCWKKGCNQYFKSAPTLQTHFREIHTRYSGSKVTAMCPDFGSDLGHTKSSEQAGGDEIKVVKTESEDSTATRGSEHQKESADMPLVSAIVTDSMKHKPSSIRCHVCDLEFTRSSYLVSHLASPEHQAISSQAISSQANIRPDSDTSFEGKVSAEISAAEASENSDRAVSTSRHKNSPSGADPSINSNSASLSHQMPTCRFCKVEFETGQQLTYHQATFCPARIYATKKPTGHGRSHFGSRRLLRSFGIECVMGFLETENAKKANNLSCRSTTESADRCESESEDERTKQETPPEMSGEVSCDDCNQSFSGLWILKAHKEQHHNQLLPEKITELFGQIYKNKFDSKENLRVRTPSPENLPPSEANKTNPTSQTSELSVKVEPQVSQALSHLPMIGGMAGNPMEMMNYTAAMAPWLGLFPFGMMPNSSAMFNPMMPQTSTTQTNPVTLNNQPLLAASPIDSTGVVARQSQANIQQNIANQPPNMGEKRARTRISDEQLQVLRQYFDINNSPTEQAIMEMALKTGLPAKVIKHWFRNTLFKERQRNKDSPYNFNNPPQTTLNLEEYEKTGKLEEVKEEEVCAAREPSPAKCEQETVPLTQALSQLTQANVGLSPLIALSHPGDSRSDRGLVDHDLGELTRGRETSLGESESGDGYLMSPHSDNSASSDGATFSHSSHMNKILNSSAYKFHEFAVASASKRANRTRFTDYQIKTLQEYFEQNAYPKDEELEQLSRVLHLANRVIVVWFQNARQKARKVYENGPSTPAESSSNTTTPGKNSYTCNKCGVTFAGYYELVKHQKRVCMKNNVVPLPFGNQDNPNGKASVETSAETPPFKRELDGRSKGQYQCSVCSKRFGFYSAWSQHVTSSQCSASSIRKILKQNSANIHHRKRRNKIVQAIFRPTRRQRTVLTLQHVHHMYLKFHSNPIPTQLEIRQMSLRLKLPPRVVQVWFQNARAKKRRGVLKSPNSLSLPNEVLRLNSAKENCIPYNNKNNESSDIGGDLAPASSVPVEPIDARDLCVSLVRTEDCNERRVCVSRATHAVTSAEKSKPEVNSTTVSKPAASSAADMARLMYGNNYMSLLGLHGMNQTNLPDNMKEIMEQSLKNFLGSTSERPDASPSTKSVSSKLGRVSSLANDSALDLSGSFSSNHKVNANSNTHLLSEESSAMLSTSDSVQPHSTADDSVSVGGSDTGADDSAFSQTADSAHSPVSPHTSVSGRSQNKRYRTNLTALQVHVMKCMFKDYKTPTMSECEVLGSYIGLQKRVVQVWFQNARAKEKKHRQLTGQAADIEEPVATNCDLCQVQYSLKSTIQDHVFSSKHILGVRRTYSGKITETDRSVMMTREEERGISAKLNKATSDRNQNLSWLQSSKSPKAASNTPTPAQKTPGIFPMGQMPPVPPLMGLPGSPDLLSLMYPGLMNPMTSLLPGLMPGSLPDLTSAMAFSAFSNPLDFGTPLSLLQIPVSAIKSIENKLPNTGLMAAMYTQDCKTIDDLIDIVSPGDLQNVIMTNVDVGYACRKCQFVFPRKESCVTHQASTCFVGRSSGTDTMLKIEQQQFTCKTCDAHHATTAEVATHCSLLSHRQSVNNINNNNNHKSLNEQPANKKIRLQ